ncbi:hypothetical protein EMIHUDRAFT_443392 [Emiliania huxleyi CCMP1516]|uniref:inositol-polyphosphate 5-phosphatase n=2 Tax=Emiliania huxleyi TaxID=2903 RepID=A0A0D3JT56_EMIH1|nr:hypothetical protein EMIHUDRAFT_443392 [Emiliania huxleyi CCMP1516]EOD26691.1 hypothetical protein EMIHUDRAFT_443392 [Emiliania huxleyi CCMP1516]|eukprot:XP_005779120.1 hypothetical protein EMIHUDRAFT_443392 [Emiliania huxleyi CCMP1516]
MRVLLLTHNVAGIFDDPDEALRPWADGLAALVQRTRADFIALHMQEVGGSRWRTCGLDGAAAVAGAVEAALPDHWSSGMMVRTDTAEDGFTALGSIYLVRRSAMQLVRLWRWKEAEGAAGAFESLRAADGPLVPQPGLPPRHCRHERFPRHLYGSTWSRKGYLLTRWQLGGGGGAVLDLVNVHNFHDESNLAALAAGASTYASCRQQALSLVTAALLGLRGGGAAGGGAAPAPASAAFLFGDFNFRLDLAHAVSLLCGAEGLQRARAVAAADATPLRLETSGGGGEGGDGYLLLGPKQFELSQPSLLARKLTELRGSDRELAAFSASAECALPLEELPLAFPPSYAYREGKGDGTPPDEAGWCDLLASKRCPAWCDRVLMDRTGGALVAASAVTAEYGHEPQPRVLTDHNQVYLAFSVESR